MNKKELNKKELESVNGAEVYGRCLSCQYRGPLEEFEKIVENDGCDTYTYYKCPKCGHKNLNAGVPGR